MKQACDAIWQKGKKKKKREEDLSSHGSDTEK
jgi:hypothetical protein